MYGRWALRKGFEVAAATLEPLRITPERAHEARERLWAVAAAVAEDDDLALLACADVIAGLYPYGWRPLAASDGEALAAELATLDDVRELALTVAGGNAFGFLAGEGGLHRFNEKLSSGGHAQSLVEVRVLAATGPDPLFEELCARGLVNDELLCRLPLHLATSLRAARDTDAPEVVRVYQVSNPRHVRDPRTAARHNDVKAVLAGDLDEFVLAYLRQAPPADGED
jgi:protein subunit release factor B